VTAAFVLHQFNLGTARAVLVDLVGVVALRKRLYGPTVALVALRPRPEVERYGWVTIEDRPAPRHDQVRCPMYIQHGDGTWPFGVGVVALLLPRHSSRRYLNHT